MPCQTGSFVRPIFALLAALAGMFAVSGVEIQDFRITENGAFAFSFSTSNSAYYRIFYSTNLNAVSQLAGPPRALTFPGPGGRALTEPLSVSGVGFYRVQEVPLAAPLDSDGDGIDDVWELLRPQVLNPLNAADAATDPDGDGQTLLRDYQLMVADHAPPEILRAIPGGSRTVAGGQASSVAVVFNEPIQAGSLAQARFDLFSAGPDQILNTPDDVPMTGGSTSYATNLRTWTLGFNWPLPDGSYRAEIAGNIRDSVGNLRGGRSAWTFRVADADFTRGDELAGRGALMPGARDEYRFTAAPGQLVMLDLDTWWGQNIHWQLRDESGERVFELLEYQSAPEPLVLVRGGRYTLEVSEDGEFSTYALRIVPVPPPQSFPLVIGGSVTNGTPGLGAGVLEVPGAQDTYTFEAVAGQAVYVRMDGLSGALQFMGWELRDEAGEQLDSGSSYEVGSGRIVLEQGGRYTLTVNPGARIFEVGTYAFSLLPAPPVLEFPLSVGGSVTNRALATSGSQHRYTFDAPAGQVVFFKLDELSEAGRSMMWRLEDEDGTELFSSRMFFGRAGRTVLERGGRYTLTVNSGAYFATPGAYAFSLLSVPPPQEFALALGDTVTNGVPAAGAGVIEKPGAQDIYTFEAPAGQEIQFDLPESALMNQISWLLRDEDGAILYNGDYWKGHPGSVVLARGGRYILTVNSNPASTAVGAYSFRIMPATPQVFSLALGDSVGKDVPGPGAGVVEMPWSRDVFAFEAVAGQEVFFRHDAMLGSATWQLRAPDGTSLFRRAMGGSNPDPVRLEQNGRHTLTIAPSGDVFLGPATYAFTLLPAPAVQEFPLVLGASVTNGVPGPGAGVIETPGARDRYAFEAAAGQVVVFRVDRVEANGSTVNWRLQDESGAKLFDHGLTQASLERVVLAQGGHYSVTVDTAATFTGQLAYAFSVLPVPPPQSFPLSLGDAGTNGLPAVVSGAIETEGAQDLYVFDSPPGQTVGVQIAAVTETMGSAWWQLWDEAGAAVGQGTFSSPFIQVFLERGGRYTLLVNADARSRAVGTYAFSLFPLPQPFWMLLGDSVTNNVPGPGAGWIESPGAFDRYEFDGAPGQVAFLRLDGLNGTLAPLQWELRDESGVLAGSWEFFPEYSPRMQFIRGGRYVLTVKSAAEWPGVGRYAFSLLSPPPPQRFSLAIGGSVTNGVPGSGAGVLEAPGAQDIYSFDATAGQAVFLSLNEVSQGLGDVEWTLKDESGWRVFRGVMGGGVGTGPLVLTRVGRYTLTINEDSQSGAVGKYAFKLLPAPAPQNFTLLIGRPVTNGVPAAGAGVLETTASQDIYTFDATPGQVVFFRLDATTGTAGSASWMLRDAGGTLVFGNQLSVGGIPPSGGPPGRVVLERGGRYTLTVNSYPAQAGMGTYAFTVLAVAAPQEFALPLNATVTNRVPRLGAGMIETPGARDVYTFEAAPGQEVFIQRPGFDAALRDLRWQLRDEGGTVLFDQPWSSFLTRRFVLARGGRYTLTVNTNPLFAGVGAYGFRILAVPPPQQFTLALDSSVTNGVPGPGAGVLETLGAQDIYTFEVPAGQTVYFRVDLVQDSLDWQLRDEDGVTLFNDRMSFWSGRLVLVRGGRYTLTLNPDRQSLAVGKYAFRLLVPPSPQEFAVAIGDSVRPGVPAPGAGVLESEGAQDFYTFDATPGQEVFVTLDEHDSALNFTTWELREANGATLFTRVLTQGDPGRVVLTRGGRYLLRVESGTSRPGNGAYAFTLHAVPPPQEFPLALGDSVSNGVPAAGAGLIDELGGRDLYTFDVTPGREVIVRLDAFDESLELVTWELRDPAGVPVFEQIFRIGQPGRFKLVRGGRYTLAVNTDKIFTGTGAYAFSLLAVPPPQEFSIALGSSVTNGVPGPGAGVIEVPGTQDVYTFNATPGQVVHFQLNAVEDAAYDIQWQLWDESREVFRHSFSWGHPGRVVVGSPGTELEFAL